MRFVLANVLPRLVLTVGVNDANDDTGEELFAALGCFALGRATMAPQSKPEVQGDDIAAHEVTSIRKKSAWEIVGM